MDCLIFGGFGYIGSRLVDNLINKGYRLTIGTRNKKNIKNIKSLNIITNYRKLNFTQLNDLVEKYDLIIDCSGISGTKIQGYSIPEIIKTNCLWTVKLAEACINTNTKLIWFSSIHAKNITLKKECSLRVNIYGLSKLITENSIFELNEWERFISIVRLGNLIGAPGKFFNGYSDLFPLDISKKLIINGRASIDSNPNKMIGYITFSDLLSSEIFKKTGFHEINNNNKNSLYALSKYIKKSYEELSNKKTDIIFKGNILNSSREDISIDLQKEIDMMINYFIKEN